MRPGARTTAFEAAFRGIPGLLTAAVPGSRARQVYRLEDRIGSGSVSEVWRATAPDGSTVAIKQLRSALRSPRNSSALLRREHGILERVAHPSIVATHGFVRANQLEPASFRHSAALVLEWLGGGDLVSVAGADPRHWIDAAIDVGEALSHLHALGVVHGDVKARNVLLDADDRARLVDFSCALPVGAKPQRPIGTATQQRLRSTGHTVSVDDDIFAFAALLHELLDGRPPFVRPEPSPGGRERLAPDRGRQPSRAKKELRRRVSGLLSDSGPAGSGELAEIGECLRAVRAERAG